MECTDILESTDGGAEVELQAVSYILGSGEFKQQEQQSRAGPPTRT